MQHVRNSLNGETKVITPAQSYNVDGYHATSNTVYEYHGCIFHGCRKCFPKQGNMKGFCHPDRTVSEVYEATLKKTAILRDAGYTVIEMWGCDFAKQKETDPELAEFLEKFEFVPPLEPRDAFFGGRTGATTLYAKTAEEEEISYVDFTSLYPSINKYGTYPVGFPQIIYRPENQNIGDYFGLAQVDILATERLFHPVLPVRAGGKLTFPLCRSSVEEEIANPLLERSNMCGHTREQRMLKGTWCTPELLKAVEKGYEILKIHEVWHFPEENRREGLSLFPCVFHTPSICREHIARQAMKYKGLVDPKNKPFSNLLPFEVQVIIMFWTQCFMTNDRRTKMNAEFTRLLRCLRTGIPMFVAFSFSSGYKRFSSAMENKPYPSFYGCPHCFRRKTKQYSVRLNIYFILQFICPLFSGISRKLIYVNDYFTILYLQAIFLKQTFSSRLIWL